MTYVTGYDLSARPGARRDARRSGCRREFGPTPRVHYSSCVRARQLKSEFVARPPAPERLRKGLDELPPHSRAESGIRGPRFRREALGAPVAKARANDYSMPS
jgi:hypothetical protein